MKTYKKLFFAALVISLSAGIMSLPARAESIAADRGVISVCEYDGETAYISGTVPVANDSVTIEVLNEFGSFDNVTDNAAFSSAAANLSYIKQVDTDSLGRYSIKWKFKEKKEGIYPVRIYLNSENKIYTSSLKIGSSDTVLDRINHWYDGADGSSMAADTLVAEAELSESTGKADTVSVIVAGYDSNGGKLVSLSGEECKVYGNSKTVVTTQTKLIPEIRYAKILVWDNASGMHPLGEASAFDVTRLVPPTGDKIYSDMVKNLGNDNVHPRISANAADFENVKYKVQNNSTIKSEYEQLKYYSNYLTNAGNLKYEMTDGYSILSTSRKFKDMMITWGMFYKVTGDEVWANKMWNQIDIVSNTFPDWNPNHFLDVGEMAYGYAVAYDWLYDWLTDEQKEMMAKTISEKAFGVIMDDYLDNPDRKRTFKWSLPKLANNWNLVCNGGVMCAALAFLDNDSVREQAKTVLSYGMKNLIHGIELYETEGDWEEGVTYWCYASSYLDKIMTSLENSTGGNYGYTSVGGVRKSFDFILAMHGMAGAFNFHETESSIGAMGTVYWFSKEFNDRNMMAYTRRELMQNYAWSDVWELLWYDGSCETASINYPSDYYGSKIDTVTMRSATSYVGFHNGKNNVSHAQLDCGTFVLDSQGYRFVKDLGKDDYSLTPKFNAYRNRAEGHNTLVINPSDRVDQNQNADCKIINHGFGDTSFAISDLTSAYIDHANSVKRGIMLTDDRKTVIVRDEMELKAPSEVYWFAHTDASVIVSNDKRSAVLKIENKYVLARILDNPDAEFSVMDAEPLPTTPALSGQAENSGRKLAIHLNDFTSGSITVGFAPIYYQNGDYSFSAVGALDRWGN